MPTYRITAKPKKLSDVQKDRIAEYITKVHSEITGAPAYYAQMIFDEHEYRRYIGGKLADSQIWIRADIRAGRTVEQRKTLVRKIVEGVSTIAEVPASDVWVYLNNVEAVDMAEFGQILPVPGQEQEWFDSLPSGLQKNLLKLISKD